MLEQAFPDVYTNFNAAFLPEHFSAFLPHREATLTHGGVLLTWRAIMAMGEPTIAEFFPHDAVSHHPKRGV